MAGFVFKLDAVLKHRQRLEDQRQRDLAQLLRQKMIFERQLTDFQGSITDDKHTMAKALTGSVDVGRIRQHASHSMQVTIRAQQIAVRLLGLSRQIDATRALLVDAMRSRKAIELLHDRQLARWKQEQDKRQTMELDEIATQRYGRRNEGAVAR